MNRRDFLKTLGLSAAALVVPSTRTIIDLNPQALPVEEPAMLFLPEPRFDVVTLHKFVQAGYITTEEARRHALYNEPLGYLPRQVIDPVQA